MKKWMIGGLIGAGCGIMLLGVIGVLMLASIGSGPPQWSVSLSAFMVGLLSGISGFLVNIGFNQNSASEIAVTIVFLIFISIGFLFGASFRFLLGKQVTFKKPEKNLSSGKDDRYPPVRKR
jgi:hypothetical protein